jgi:UDP-glucose 4-epimerase
MNEIQDQVIFITGGAGFIGSALAERLVEHNQIVIYDDFSRDALTSKKFIDHKHLTIIKGDVLDYRALSEAMKGANLVVHCAGVAGVDTVIQSPTRTLNVNIVGSINVLKAACELDRCSRVVCFSTSEVFGQRAFGSQETDTTSIGAVGEARWIYAVSKLAEEHAAIAYWKEKKLPTTVVRPFNIYGPGQVGEGAIRVFIEQALRGETIYIHGDGTQIRAWCYVDDMVEGTLCMMSMPEAIGESFNIGNRRSVETIYGLANTIIRTLGSRSEVKFSGNQRADVELRIPSVEKAKALLQFEARVGLEEGILRTAAYYRARSTNISQSRN